MLEKLRHIVLIFSILPVLAHAQVDSSFTITDLIGSPSSVQPTQAVLWKIEGEGLPAPSYIYGVLHKVRKPYFFIHPEINTISQKVDLILMAVDPLNYDIDYLQRGTIPLDSTLDVLLPPKTYRWMEKFIDDSLSERSRDQFMGRYPPLYLARQMMSDYCLGFGPEFEPLSYEEYLRTAIPKPFEFVGTGWTRTAWIESFSYRDQTEELLILLDKRRSKCKTYQTIMESYRKEDLDQVWLLSVDAPDFGGNMSQLVEVRNQAWMNSLRYKIYNQPVLAIMHAVQLPGEYGLLHQLRKQGFKVTGVSLNTQTE
ncbi:MAG: TraB/GumN family protein [Bacteroidota bacterium]